MDGWAAIAARHGGTDEDTVRLRAYLGRRMPPHRKQSDACPGSRCDTGEGARTPSRRRHGPGKGSDRTMPHGSSTKRVRQYEHIKESAQEGGVSEERAEEIAARTVNRERARSAESRTATDMSVHDLSSAWRSGPSSHGRADGPTRDQLYEEARKKNVKGRSNMTKSQLARAVGR